MILFLRFYASNIPVGSEAKFLGVIFDRKLSIIPHIKYLKNKCLKALNFFKGFISYKMGSRQNYTFTIISIVDSIKIRSRINCVRFRQKIILADDRNYTSSGTSLSFRSISYQAYMLKQMSQRCHCAEKNFHFSMLLDLLLIRLIPLLKLHSNQNLYENNPNAIKSFGIRIALLLEASNINP